MSTRIKLKHAWNMIRYNLSFMLFSFYLTVAFLFLFTHMWEDLIPKGRTVIGLGLLLFGAFRFYVAYRRYKSKKNRIEAIRQLHKNATTE
jgi:hypothetical protein